MSTASTAPDNEDTVPSFSKAEPTLLGMPHEIQLKILRLVLPAAVLEVSVPESLPPPPPSPLLDWFEAPVSDKYSPSFTVKRPRGSEAILLTCNGFFDIGITIAYEQLTLVIPLLLEYPAAASAAWCDKFPLSLRKRVTKVVLKPNESLAQRYKFKTLAFGRGEAHLVDLSSLPALREIEFTATYRSARCQPMLATGRLNERLIREEIMYRVTGRPIESFLDSVQCRPGVKLSGEVVVNSCSPYARQHTLEKFANLDLETNKFIKH